MSLNEEYEHLKTLNVVNFPEVKQIQRPFYFRYNDEISKIPINYQAVKAARDLEQCFSFPDVKSEVPVKHEYAYIKARIEVLFDIEVGTQIPSYPSILNEMEFFRLVRHAAITYGRDSLIEWDASHGIRHCIAEVVYLIYEKDAPVDNDKITSDTIYSLCYEAVVFYKRPFGGPRLAPIPKEIPEKFIPWAEKCRDVIMRRLAKRDEFRPRLPNGFWASIGFNSENDLILRL